MAFNIVSISVEFRYFSGWPTMRTIRRKMSSNSSLPCPWFLASSLALLLSFLRSLIAKAVESEAETWSLEVVEGLEVFVLFSLIAMRAATETGRSKKKKISQKIYFFKFRICDLQKILIHKIGSNTHWQSCESSPGCERPACWYFVPFLHQNTTLK